MIYINWISTTIKRIYLDKILSGDKLREYKGSSEYWDKRLYPLLGWHLIGDLGINFLCGKESYKFFVDHIIKVFDPSGFEIDGITFTDYYEISIGRRIK